MRASPPAPFGLKTPEGVDDFAESLRRAEVQRGAAQIMNAVGVTDLRSIVVIRRAFQVSVPHTHTEKERDLDNSGWAQVWSRPEESTDSDNEDEGGEEVLGKVTDRSHLRMKRSFELLLKTGNVVRFEVCH